MQKGSFDTEGAFFYLLTRDTVSDFRPNPPLYFLFNKQ